MARVRWVTVFVIALVACGDDDGVVPDGAVTDGGACRTDVDCDDGTFCNGAEMCAAGACVAGTPPSCDDGIECTTDRCDETALRCVNEAPDADGDGRADSACGGDDCDDTDPERYPGNTEVCDDADHDEDCDPATFGFRDADGDGFPDDACCNDDNCGNDCDDTLPSAHPGEAESCDGFDNDCDGMTDEGVTNTYWVDDDGDGFGDPDGATMLACFTPSGFASSDTDCDDMRGFVRPGGLERCDSEDPPLDENCDGVANPPELCNCSIGDSRTCAEGGFVGECSSGTQGCDTGAWGACSIAPIDEVCNTDDDDCDGLTDEGLTVQCWADVDGDTYALAGAPELFLCPDPARPSVGGCPVGTTNREPVGETGGIANFECDDADPAIRPDQSEVCNGIDDNCRGGVDEGTTVECYMDDDGDGYAPSGAPRAFVCPAAGGSCPVGFTDRDPASAIDCDDTDVGISPAVSEVCDGSTDEDCDGSIDEGTTVTCYTDGDGDTYSPASATPSVQCADSMTGTCPVGATTRSPAMGADCDDGAAGINPVAGEVCDGDDQDCDGSTDEGTQIDCWSDGDGDGYAAGGATRMSLCPVGGMCPAATTSTEPTGLAIDCDDGDAGQSPGVAEVCDGDDEDCDGRTDEGETVICYTDGDSDGFPPTSATPMAVCPVGSSCPGLMTPTAPSGGEDCDDADAGVTFEIACWTDMDGDGFAPASSATIPFCGTTCGSGLTDVPPTAPDCDDSDMSVVFPINCFTDADGDGYAAAGATAMATCAATCPTNQTLIDPSVGLVDCDDGNANRSPALLEVCDDVTDEDCDGDIDEGLRVNLHRDDDGDGYGVTAESNVCPGTPGYTNTDGDCRDDHADVYPAQNGFFTEPACPRGAMVCTTSLGGLGCIDPAGGGTTCESLMAYWDYNCTGNLDNTPAPLGPPLMWCPTPTCSGACNGYGPKYIADPLYPPLCGQTVQNWFCACDLGGGCSDFQDVGSTATVGCR